MEFVHLVQLMLKKINHVNQYATIMNNGMDQFVSVNKISLKLMVSVHSVQMAKDLKLQHQHV